MNQALDSLTSSDAPVKNFRVLVVDDDVDLGESLRDVLELEDPDLEVRVVTNAEDAVLLADEFRPAIALLDIKLDRSSGLDLVPVLKRKNPDIFCIMMTAFRESEYAVTAVKFGADDYLHKPIDPQKLLQTLDTFKQKKIALDEKRAAERRFRAVFNQTYQMVFIIARDGSLIDANNMAVAFMQSPKPDLLGMHISKLPRFSDQPGLFKRLSAGLQRAVDAGETDRMQLRVVSEFEDMEFDCSMKPVVDDNGALEYVVLEARDITALKRAEREVRRMNSELEQRVLERTVDLDQALRRAEHASDAKSRFLSRMSHELRTPMNAIMGFAQLLAFDDDPELAGHQRQYVEELLRAGGHLLGMIDDVLDLTHMEAGTLQFDLMTVPLNELLLDVQRMIKGRADEKNIELRAPEDMPVLEVNADPLRLKKVMLNLLDNAVKFSDPGSVVSLEVEETGNGLVKVTVADNGCGINEEDLARIFSPFEIVVVDDFSNGMGIGLSMVKSLVEQMGGEVGVSSRPGQGSRFWVTLRTADTGAGQAAGAKVITLPSAVKRVLLISQDESSYLSLKRMMSSRNDTVLQRAAGVRQALDMARTGRPDLILMEIGATDVDALQLKAMLDDVLKGNVPVLAIVSSATKVERQSFAEAGFVTVIQGPLQADLLWRSIEPHLKMR